MGVLDDILLGRRGDQHSLQSNVLRDYMQSKVVSLTEKGIAFERLDNRASTLGAATALQRTTGRVPEGFFTGVSQNAPNTFDSSIMAFQTENAQQMFKKLTDAGVASGTTLAELSAKAGGGDIEELLRTLMAGQGAKSNPTAQPFNASTTKSANGSDASGGNGRGTDFMSRFLNSFKQQKQGGLNPLPTVKNSSVRNANDSALDRFFNGSL